MLFARCAVPAPASDQCHQELERADEGKCGAPGGVRAGPLVLDQAPVPGKQGAGCHDPVQPKVPGQQPRQGGDHGPVGPARLRAGDLAAAHCAAGVNRGPSMAAAILMALGVNGPTVWQMIVSARPQVSLAYFDDAVAAVASLGYATVSSA